MKRLSSLWRNLLHRDRVERDLDDELRETFALLVDEKIRAGLEPARARRAARLELGGHESVADSVRDARTGAGVDGVVQDIRYAWRLLRRSPGFTAVAVAILALGIGSNAMMFTITNAVLFKGFPQVSRNDRLLYMTTQPYGGVSYADFEEWRGHARSFERMALVHGTQHTYSDLDGFPETFTTTEATSGTFRLVGQRPILGRDFVPSDEMPGAPPVAILSYRFWERRYASDRAIVGRLVRINGHPTTVIGVMPRGFSFPQNQELWVPLVPTPDVRRPDNYNAGWFVVGRVAEGVTIESARAELDAIGRRRNRASSAPINAYRFHEFFIGTTATAIYEAMWAAVAIVLLVACANLANLLLARALGRSREISVRIALGAGRWRIVRQLLIESVMLSAAGGLAGWWIAEWGVHVYAAMATGAGLSPDIGGTWFDNILDYTLDYRAFAYLVAISIGTGVLFGLAPASRLLQLDVNATLKDGGRGVTPGRSRHVPAVLVIAEMALAVVLLAGAGVMIRSFWKIYAADLGFAAENVVVAFVPLPGARYQTDDARTTFFDRLTARLDAVPGIDSAAIVQSSPGVAAWQRGYELAGVPALDPQRRPVVRGTTIGPAYFRTIGATLRAGREFTETDGLPGPPVVIVTRRFAGEAWPGEDAIGKRLRLFTDKSPDEWLTVVGVADSVRNNAGYQQDVDPWVYVPYRQQPSAGMRVLVRSASPPGSVGALVRSHVHDLDAILAIQSPVSLTSMLADRYRYRGITGTLFLICAALALLLASVGLYGVLARAVSRRTQEIGVRMAIGASARDILALVMKQGMLPLGAGLALGLLAALAVMPLLRSQLVEVSPADPLTLALTSAVLVISGTIGCLIPALRATRVDPVAALRHE